MIHMSSQTGAELLAERLGTDTQQASLLLDRFAAGMAAVLLGGGRLVVDGLGTFSVVHDHAARSTTGNGAVFMPPKERIAFDPHRTSLGDSSRIAVERLGMGAGEAAGFAKALAGMFGQLRSKNTGFEMRGFGNLSVEKGTWTFSADVSLEELLNGLYEGLKGIEMPGRSAKSSPKGGSGVLKPAVIGIAVILLGVGGYFASDLIPSSGGGTHVPVPSPSVVKVPTSVARTEAAPPSPAKAQPDSVLLGKGRYTVITATFTSLNTAREEARRLTGLGHRIMIWPVRSESRRYYRLVTGDFPGHREARDSLRKMPAGLSKNVYIQEANKNVFIYGEQGL
jgi:nucleoid DNA-binding protein